MKRYIFLILIYLFSCNKTKEDLCLKIDEGIRKSIEDEAFRGNYNYQIFELKTSDFTNIDGAGKDSLMRLNIYDQFDYYKKMFSAQKDLVEAELELARAAESSGLMALKDTQIRLAMKESDILKAYSDTLRILTIQDSIIAKSSKVSLESNENYYYSKTFLKATLNGRNWMDSCRYILDKNFRVVPNKNLRDKQF